jgi:hypothetical protein
LIASNQAIDQANCDEVAPFSAARHSGIPETKAMVTSRAFGCGCAALRCMRANRAADSLARGIVWFALRFQILLDPFSSHLLNRTV